MAIGKKTGGRKKGSLNRITTDLKEAILRAAEEAHENGTVGYLTWLANNNSGAFASLLGKILPMVVAGDPANPLAITTIRRVVVYPQKSENGGEVGKAS
jgi:hypothetical protein